MNALRPLRPLRRRLDPRPDGLSGFVCDDDDRASFLVTIVEFGGIWAMFRRFGQIGGWRLGEVALFYGLVSVIFAISDAITRGFDVFGTVFVKTGGFDRLLLRPRSPALQLMGYELRLTRIGRFAQGVLVFWHRHGA